MSQPVLPFAEAFVYRRGGETRGIISTFRRPDSDFIGELPAGGIYHWLLKHSSALLLCVATAVRKLVKS